MEFAGIITEYDPFHNGHAAQIAAAKSAGAGCVAVCMSSGAVQRGGVPVLPESVRVCAALDAGADLVITLPAPYACATAEQFASAGVRLLTALGCDTLVFGAEDPDTAQLSQVAELLARPELDALLRERLSTGMTYAAARAEAADALLPGAGTLLRTPNNILGIEYCKALLGQNAPLRPVTIRREGSAHDGTLAPDTHPSASGLRALLRQGKREEALSLLPPAVARAYELEEAAGRAPVFWENSHRAILARLRQMTEEEFAAYDGGGEGLYHRVYDAVRRCATVEELRVQAQREKELRNLDLLVVDYLQILRTSARLQKRYEAVGHVSRALKDIALDLQVPVVAMAQVGRQTVNAGGERAPVMPDLSDLRESGNIEQDADIVIFLHHPTSGSDRSIPSYDLDTRGAIEAREGYQYIVVRVAKQRQGENGSFGVEFDAPHMTYTCIAR